MGRLLSSLRFTYHRGYSLFRLFTIARCLPSFDCNRRLDRVILISGLIEITTPRINRLDDEGIGLSGLRGSPAAYERARLSYTDDVFYEDVGSTSWNLGEGKAEVEGKNGGEAWNDDDSGSLTSVD